jgi:hypothetical protein
MQKRDPISDFERLYVVDAVHRLDIVEDVVKAA